MIDSTQAAGGSNDLAGGGSSAGRGQRSAGRGRPSGFVIDPLVGLSPVGR